MRHRLPTFAQLRDHLIEEYGCTEKRIDILHPVTKKPVRGGCFFRQVAGEGQARKYPYMDDDIGPVVSEYLLRHLCGKLAVDADEVLDWFDRHE